MAKIAFTLNGEPTSIDVDADRRLNWVTRTELGLTGTKTGCGMGTCGACTVLVDNKAVRSCRTSVKHLEGKSVVTIEGLSKNGKLHPVQKAFIEHDALQCGFCTPGMIMKAVGLLLQKPGLNRKEIIQGMGKNLCRCGAHLRILRALEQAAQSMKGEL